MVASDPLNHPYLACLAFRACKRGDTVDANLIEVQRRAVATALGMDAEERVAEIIEDTLRRLSEEDGDVCDCPDDSERPYRDQCAVCQAGPKEVARAVLAAIRGDA